MGDTPGRSPLPATPLLLVLLFAPSSASTTRLTRRDPGFASGSRRGGAAGTQGSSAGGTRSESRRRPARPTASAPGRPIRVRLGRALRPIRSGGSGARSRRAQSEPRESGAGGGAAAARKGSGSSRAGRGSPGQPSWLCRGGAPADTWDPAGGVAGNSARARRWRASVPRRWGSAGEADEGWGRGRAAREVLAPRVLPLARRAPKPPRAP